MADEPGAAGARRQKDSASATLGRMNSVHPKKLLLTKWTAVRPSAKEKHFLVTKVIMPDLPEEKIEWIDIEATYSKASRRIQWRELRDQSQWRQGWV